ncbi:MAG TPA: hypothetical protein VEY71_01890 [Chitinophagales bacterium]|nr:hypothetical protein [Chitinophagales bacterium]
MTKVIDINTGDEKQLTGIEWNERYNRRLVELGEPPETELMTLSTGQVAYPNNPEAAAEKIAKMLRDPNHPANTHQGNNADES